jgi:hypothetical protein
MVSVTGCCLNPYFRPLDGPVATGFVKLTDGEFGFFEQAAGRSNPAATSIEASASFFISYPSQNIVRRS